MLLVIATMALVGLSADYRAFQPKDAAIRHHYTAEFQSCTSNPSNGGTVEQAQCAGAEDDRQNRALNAVWLRVMARLNETDRAVLRSAQRQWLISRDALAEDAASDYVNSTKALMYGTAYADETIRRTIWLEKLR